MPWWKPLFPTNEVQHHVILNRIGDDGVEGTASILFKAQDLPIVKAFFEAELPALKVTHTSNRHGKKNEIRHLGVCPPGVIPGWHKSKRSFPPVTRYRIWACVTVDVHANYERKTARASHIDSGGCKYRCYERTLEGDEYVLLTFSHEEHVHTCSTDKYHLHPLNDTQKAAFARDVINYPSVKCFYEKAIVPHIAECAKEGRAPGRLASMTVSQLERLARSMQLVTEPTSGKDDLTTVTPRVKRAKVHVKG